MKEALFEEVEVKVPKILPIKVNDSVVKDQMNKAKKEKKWVLVFVIGTKPCFYKFWGSIAAADRKGVRRPGRRTRPTSHTYNERQRIRHGNTGHRVHQCARLGAGRLETR